MNSRLVLALAATALAAAACGSSSGGDDPTLTAGGPGSSPQATVDVPTAGATSLQATGQSAADLAILAKKPVVTVPTGPAPTKVTTKDIVVGTGTAVASGTSVMAKYVGVLYKTGKEFDSSWKVSADNTFAFQVGAGQVIPGFDQGVLGMKVGGRREIIIPSADGYGAAGSPPVIPANSDLIFVIDVVSAS